MFVTCLNHAVPPTCSPPLFRQPRCRHLEIVCYGLEITVLPFLIMQQPEITYFLSRYWKSKRHWGAKEKCAFVMTDFKPNGFFEER